MYNFPEELREVVNDHWSQFPPQHPLVADIFGILFLVLTVVNFISNFLVIYVYLGTEELRTPVSYYDTLFENHSKCPIVIFLILPFSINFCPTKTDLSGNTVWQQASGFQKLAKLDFLAFLTNFCPLKM